MSSIPVIEPRRPGWLTATFAVSVAAVMLVAVDAGAQDHPTTAQRADDLFAQGKASLAADDFAHACPKLAESYALDPARGTLLALAICHEGLGRAGTAWREFRSVAEAASRDGRSDRARFARDHMAKLEPKLSRLTLVVAEIIPGLEVEVDGIPLAQGDWGKAVPIDAGRHTIAAHAPGGKAWTSAVDIGPERDARTLEIGPLASETPESRAPSGVLASPATTRAVPVSVDDATVAPDSAWGDWRRKTGWILGGVGVAAIGVGAYFGVSAITKSGDAKSRCSPSLCTDADAVRENGDARTAAVVSNVSIGAGVAILAVGASFLFAAPTVAPPPSALRFIPVVGRQQASAVVEGAW
jgi:hypothetical protein